ncbi:MAG: hypothetical protein BGO56_14375 [Sphingobacteriales bacterium 48-107]|jgi:hypothetical protein|nr:MAG: hypothetical protein BGO56_14375 [Sphingobacteriales bacterium 48-107]
MKAMESAVLIDDLQAQVRRIIATATTLKQLLPVDLDKAPAPGAWSVAQILAHLNFYGDYYLPALEKALAQAPPAKKYFKPGWLGNYFTKLISPNAAGEVRGKMKSPAQARPSSFVKAVDTLPVFIGQQQWLLELLEEARTKDLGSVRVPISIAKMIRLKAGDTFRFLIGHQQRHLLQLTRTLHQLQLN